MSEEFPQVTEIQPEFNEMLFEGIVRDECFVRTYKNYGEDQQSNYK